MGRALCHEGRGLLWAKLAIPRGGGFFPGPKSGNSAVQTYTRISAVGGSILPTLKKFHSTTINKPNGGEEPRWCGVHCGSSLLVGRHLGDLRGITR